MAASPLPVTGSSYARDRLKVRTIGLKFIVDGPREDGGDEPYDLLDTFAPPAPMSLTEVGRSSSKMDDGDWALTITFEGITEDEATGALLEYDNSSVDLPIETFPKFDLLAEKYKAQYDGPKNDQFIGWQKNFSPDTGVAPADTRRIINPMYGTSHFVDGNAILRVTFLLKDFNADLLRNLCKIDTPQIPRGTEKAVQTPEGKTWLKKSVKARFRGNVWEIEVEYWLGRWAPDIYSPTE